MLKLTIACRNGLEVLYAAGARKFIVWHVSAGDVVPLVNTMNNLLNTMNTILVGLGQIDAKPNALKTFTKGFVVRRQELAKHAKCTLTKGCQQQVCVPTGIANGLPEKRHVVRLTVPCQSMQSLALELSAHRVHRHSSVPAQQRTMAHMQRLRKYMCMPPI
jgi:hypothetical protein